MIDFKLKCKVCEQEFKKIDCVTRHAKIVHNIEPKQYYDKFFKTETEGKCKYCGTETQYWNLFNGYREFCSRKCFWKYTNNLDVTKEKREQTCLKKYGVKSYMQCDDFKEKSMKTCIKEYGVVNAGGSLESIQKIKQTKLERYDNENWNNCKVDYKESNTLEKFKNDCIDSEILSYHNKKFTCKCKTCNKEFNILYQVLYNRIYTFNTQACIYCNPINTFSSAEEKQVSNFLKESIMNQKNEIDIANRLQCQVCGQTFTRMDSVTRHLKQKHNLANKEYYDKYLNKDEGKCKQCGGITTFIGIATGYNEFCSRACSLQYEIKNKPVKPIKFTVKKVNTTVNMTEEQKILEKYKAYNDINCDINGYQTRLFKCKCHTCGNNFNIDYDLFNLRYFKQHVTLCTVCNPISNKCSDGTEVIKYLSIANLEFIEHDRKVLNGQELDIYLPNNKLAIEFDGLYWHSELYKDKNYHLEKTKACEALGIQLIHIFEDEWLFKQDIVKSRLSGLLGINNRIYARKCVVKQVEDRDAKQFLNDSHIQGYCPSKYRYGLYYNNELVSLMTFGKSRFADEFELLRFCNKLNTNVIGGAGKLFNTFMKEHPDIREIVSFADRRWSIGNLYEKLGFAREYETSPAYFYIVDNMRRNRVEYQKHKLIAREMGTEAETEHEIMLKYQYYRIYDCGNIKYRIKNPNKIPEKEFIGLDECFF